MKRLLQFRLSTLFCMVLLSAILIQGYLSSTRESRAIAKLEKQGAILQYYSKHTRVDGPNDPEYEYCNITVPPTADLAPIADLRTLRDLRVHDRTWTGRDAQIIARCSALHRISADGARGVGELIAGSQQLAGLRVLLLRKAKVGSADLAYLNPRLERLDVGDCGIDDAGVASIALLPNIKFLDLDRCRATDVGLAALQSCHELQYLSLLFSHDVGDGSLGMIAALPKLATLTLNSDNLTDAGARKILGSRSLQKASIYGKRVDPDTSRSIKEHFERAGP